MNALPELITQPQDTVHKPLFEIESYAGKKGLALSFKVNMRDEAVYPREDPKYHKRRKDDWFSCEGNKYIPQQIHNRADAIRAVENFHLPEDIRQEASRAARRLVSAFEKVATMVTIRDLPHGKLDRRKLSEVVEAAAAGTYDPNRIRPFRKTLSAPAKTPVIAIVASAGMGEMWADANFIPKIVRITLGVQWACEAAGMQVYAALVEGNQPVPGSGYTEATRAHIIADPFRTMPMSLYGALFHRDLYRYAKICAESADHRAHEGFCLVEGMNPRFAEYGCVFSAMDGGNAVNWARQNLNADLVLSIGNNTDAKDADLVVERDWNLDKAVEEVVKQAKKLGRK